MNECIQCRIMVADWERIGGLCNACNDIKKSREIRGDNVCMHCGTLTNNYEQVCMRCQHNNMKGKKHTKKDLEDKISQLEDKLTTLADQLDSKPKGDIFSLDDDNSIESYFGQYPDYQSKRVSKLEAYEKEYLSRIEHEPKTMPKGFEYTKPLPPIMNIRGGTLPKGFGQTGKTYSLSELDGKPNQISVRTRLLMSVVITGVIAVVLGASLGELGMIVAVGSSPIPFTLIAIALKKIKINNKNEYVTHDAVKASLLQSMLITLGVVKVKEQPKSTGNLPSSPSRGTLPKGF